MTESYPRVYAYANNKGTNWLIHLHSLVRTFVVIRQVHHAVLFFRNFDFLIPDGPELIAEFLEGEQDMSCKRNAFMMLIHADQVSNMILNVFKLQHLSK